MQDELYPPGEPFATGRLGTTDGASLYWEASGNPRGQPALYLHGGPGSGLRSGSYRRRFDPDRYLVVGLDQRGCGRSRPLATDALDRLPDNTTATLIADIEALRRHLGIEAWLLSGVSWGATLALAYAETEPNRVTALVLAAVTTTSRAEVDWITEGMGRIFPEAFERFEWASERQAGERIVAAYARRLSTGGRDERLAAAQAWNEWEETHIALDPNWTPMSARFDGEGALNFATLVTHYWAHDGLLPGGHPVLDQIDRIAHVPAFLIHGRRDISGPLITPWQLHRRWPASRLVIIEDEGHGGPRTMLTMKDALDGFATG